MDTVQMQIDYENGVDDFIDDDEGMQYVAENVSEDRKKYVPYVFILSRRSTISHWSTLARAFATSSTLREEVRPGRIGDR